MRRPFSRESWMKKHATRLRPGGRLEIVMAKAKVTFRRWDIADNLQTEEDIQAYLEVVAEENNPALRPGARRRRARAT